MTADTPTLPACGGVRLLLVRHGETPSNVRRALDTVPPGPSLTERGRRQAEALPERVAKEPVHAVHASRALRAQETAAPLARQRGLDVRVTDGMQEIYVGELEGTTDPESRRRFEDIYARWHLGKLDEPMPGGETGRQALTRFVEAARQAVDPLTEGTLVLVSHGAIVRLVAGYLAVNVDAQRANAAYLPNTGTIALDASPMGWFCVHWDGLDGAPGTVDD